MTDFSLIVALVFTCLVANGSASPAKSGVTNAGHGGNICQMKCKECHHRDAVAVPINDIGQCVQECVQSGDTTAYDCIDECAGEGGGNECDAGTTNCVNTVQGYYCECKDGMKQRLSAIMCAGCYAKMGMENGEIPDDAITSTPTGSGWDAYKGRLNRGGKTAWLLAAFEPVWIQADFGYNTYITGVITQGGVGWFTQLTVSTFLDGSEESFILDDDTGAPMIFDANTDQSTAVTNLFPEHVHASAVRINGYTRNSYWDIRFEILGCKQQCSIMLE